MLTIEGSLQILPLGISTDIGKLTIDGKQQPCVVQTFLTESGPVSLALPTDIIDKVVSELQDNKERAIADSNDLYIPGSDEEVKEIKAGFDKVNEGKE